MKRVGIREFKAHLCDYLTRVQAGEDLIVTKRGKAVARVQGIPEIRDDLPESLRSLVEEGRLIDKGPARYLPKRIRMTPGEETSTDLIREQRR